jgi:hypothetical protein
VFPLTIGNLSELIHLDLRSNSITDLPSSLAKLTNLKHLELSSNDLLSLPSFIGDLSSLTFLSSYSIRLSSLPSSFGNLRSLEYLDLSSNQLKTIPQSLSSLRNLSYLDLYDNKISGTIPAFLGDLTSTKISLYFDNNENLGGPIPTSFCNLANKNAHLYLYKTSISCQPRCLLSVDIGVSDLDVCGTNQTQETGFVVQSLFFGPGCEGGGLGFQGVCYFRVLHRDHINRSGWGRVASLICTTTYEYLEAVRRVFGGA